MQVLKDLFWSIFGFEERPKKERQLCVVSYAEADRMLRANEGWQLAPEEDTNNKPNQVYLERYV